MDCAQYREALSARLDGESLGTSDGDLDRHLAGCTAGPGLDPAAAPGRRPRRPAPRRPAPPRLARQRLGWSRARWVGTLRIALAVVGVAQAAIGWPALALGMDTMQAPEHVAHESGAW